jgi:hypothetical protein
MLSARQVQCCFRERIRGKTEEEEGEDEDEE